MPKGENQRYKLLYLAKIMVEKTDENHFLTMPQIIDLLAKEGVGAERKSLYNDLKDLDKFGIEVIGESVGRGYQYHVVSHRFDLPELKLLVDAIQSSKFITEKKSTELIEKLESFVSEYEAKQLQRQVFVSGRIKTMNESIYYNVDAIHSAINGNKKIRFQYYQWNVKKERELRHDGALYHISPWGLSWDDENYYLIGYDSKVGKIKHYRVDKMLHISLSDETREGKEHFKQFDMASYAKQSFGMFSGEEEVVKLKMKNSFAGVIIDRFGMDVMMIPAEEGWFTVSVHVKISDQFLSWVFALGEGAEIVGPQSVLDRVQVYVDRLMRQYKK